MTSLFLQPFKWDVIDKFGENGNLCINCWAFDRNSQTYLIRIEDFWASCCVELPTKIDGCQVDWNQEDAGKFYRSLCHRLKNSSEMPVEYTFTYRPKLYYYQRRKFPVVELFFKTLEAMRTTSRKLKYPIGVEGKGKCQAKVWEEKFPTLRKFQTAIGLESAQWFEVKADLLEDHRKQSHLANEYIASYRDIRPLSSDQTEGWMTHPKMLVLDIEAYSQNHQAFPQAINSSDRCFMISVIVQRLGLPETREKWLVVYGDCQPIDGVKIIKTNSEIECIQSLAELVKQLDPDIISGYNHHGFDNDYLNQRLERVVTRRHQFGNQDIIWPDMGRLIPNQNFLETFSYLEEKSWRSAGYGYNDVKIIRMSGRISIDMLSVIKRDYKLTEYSLDTVARFFLKRGKHPVKPVEIFKAYERLQKLFQHPDRFSSKDSEVILEEFTRVARYCVEDSELVVDLAEKIHLWIASVESANTVGVSIEDLYLRGQQIRCLSKIYDEAHRRGFLVDFQEALNVVFNGGAVEKPEPGVEDEVPCYDFSSLYPSIIIEFNIDYTTFLPDNLPKIVSEDQCNVIEFYQFERPKKTTDKVYKEDFDREAEINQEAQLVHRRLLFVKKSVYEGVVPKILRTLIDTRKRVKRLIEELKNRRKAGQEVDEVELIRLDKYQLALKISSNSYFGFLGAHIGKLPLIEAAMAITAKGREMIHYLHTYLQDKYGAKIKYGDTDSVMPKFPHLDSLNWVDKYKFFKQLERELSDLFPGRIAMELEKIMRIITFAPKMYAALLYDQEGNLLTNPKDLLVKGIILARRDGTPWVRYHYRKILFNILVKYSPDRSVQADSMQESFNLILEAVRELLENRVDWRDLAKVNELGANYKNPNYALNVLANHLSKIGRPAQPGDRLCYLVCDIAGETTIGRKIRTVDEFLDSQETSQPLTLDNKYYLENALQMKIDPLFSVGYNQLMPYLRGLGYRPFSSRHFVGVNQPVKMISRVLEDNQIDLATVERWFQEIINRVNWQELPRPRKVRIRKRQLLQPEGCVFE